MMRHCLTTLASAAIALASVSLVASPAFGQSSTSETSILPVGGTFTMSGVPVTPAADANGCGVTMQNPHYSTGAAGIIEKANWTCQDVPTTVYINYPNYVAGYDLILWFCGGTFPQASVPYLISNCSPEGDWYGHFTITSSGNGGEVTRYSPPQGQPGAHGSGFWIASVRWTTEGPNGSDGYISYSAAVIATG